MRRSVINWFGIICFVSNVILYKLIFDLVIGDAGVQGFGLRASGGKRAWASESEGGDDVGLGGNSEAMNADGANKLYVGLLIMLIFSEALALYGLIVALILSQHSYVCE